MHGSSFENVDLPLLQFSEISSSLFIFCLAEEFPSLFWDFCLYVQLDGLFHGAF